MDQLETWVKDAGGLSKAAEHLGVSYQLLQHWLKTGVPYKRVPSVAQATGIPAKVLRPELFAVA